MERIRQVSENALRSSKQMDHDLDEEDPWKKNSTKFLTDWSNI